VTKIIDVITREGKFSFRCYGAEAFADLIRKQLDLTVIDISRDTEKAEAFESPQWKSDQSSTGAPDDSKDEIIKVIEQLKHLHDQGAITDQEFEVKKKKLLDRL
jgi:hypothetical protein